MKPARPARLTVWIVPEGLDSPPWQLSVRVDRLRQGAVLGAALLLWTVGLLGALGFAAWQGRAAPRLVDENLALKARVVEIEARLDGADRELRRLRLYGAQLDPAGDGPPGEGPIDPTELAAGGLPAPVDPGADEAPWLEDDLALDDLGEEEALALGPPGDPLDALDARSERILDDLRFAELELGLAVEAAERGRLHPGEVPRAWPLLGQLTSGFGWRRSPFTRRWKFHSGLDISAPVGTVIRASAAGVVRRAEYDSGYGRLLEIDHGGGVVTRYAHNSRLLVGVGELVAAGQPISTVGMTGATTGPHLHYEVYVGGQAVDPLEHLE